MEKDKNLQNKAIRPRRNLTYHRLELYGLLDELIRIPIILLKGSPGLGKTTLLVSYTEFRNIPCLWYQMDEEDKDLDDFLNHLRNAVLGLVSHDGAGLPRMTLGRASNDDYQIGGYFKKLFSFLKKSFVIVFDDYHKLPKDSPLHDAIAEAGKMLPSWGRIVLIADDDSHVELSHLRAQNMVAILDRDDLKLTKEEIKNISELHGVNLTPEQVALQLEGNAGGLVGVLTQKLKGEWRCMGRERTKSSTMNNTENFMNMGGNC